MATGCPCGDFLAGDGEWLAQHLATRATHQIDVDVIVVIDVRARRQDGIELAARAGLHVAQKTLLFRQAMPAILYGDAAPVREREGCDIERIAERMLRNMRVRIAVHAPAGVGRDLLDLHDARSEPALR